MNVLNYPALTSWTEVCVQMHQKWHFNHPCCRSSPRNLLESSPNMDNRIKRDCFSEQSSLEAGRLWPNFLWWQFSSDVMRWDLTPANAASFLTVLLTFIGWLWIICCRVILVVRSKLCFQRQHKSPESQQQQQQREERCVCAAAVGQPVFTMCWVYRLLQRPGAADVIDASARGSGGTLKVNSITAARQVSTYLSVRWREESWSKLGVGLSDLRPGSCVSATWNAL